jgi:hypothetical protein
MDGLVDLLAILAPAGIGVAAFILGAWLSRSNRKP